MCVYVNCPQFSYYRTSIKEINRNSCYTLFPDLFLSKTRPKLGMMCVGILGKYLLTDTLPSRSCYLLYLESSSYLTTDFKQLPFWSDHEFFFFFCHCDNLLLLSTSSLFYHGLFPFFFPQILPLPHAVWECCRVPGWFGLEGTLKLNQFQSLATGRDTFH